MVKKLIQVSDKIKNCLDYKSTKVFLKIEGGPGWIKTALKARRVMCRLRCRARFLLFHNVTIFLKYTIFILESVVPRFLNSLSAWDYKSFSIVVTYFKRFSEIHALVKNYFLKRIRSSAVDGVPVVYRRSNRGRDGFRQVSQTWLNKSLT